INIIKYSKAKNVVIDLHCDEVQLRMEIADDGRGFDPKATRRGLGLSNIYERTSLYNGNVILDAAPGKGCTLIVNIPVS
ncbi:MAG: ATP-binding protein, partial [Bacteroidota bacterium]|nr:ATP-binding protein [Bacteroidota bacterium]